MAVRVCRLAEDASVPMQVFVTRVRPAPCEALRAIFTVPRSRIGSRFPLRSGGRPEILQPSLLRSPLSTPRAGAVIGAPVRAPFSSTSLPHARSSRSVGNLPVRVPWIPRCGRDDIASVR